MSVLFLANERESFRENSPGAISMTSSSTDYVRGSISIDTGSGVADSRVIFASGQSQLWVRFWNIANPAGSSPSMRIFDQAGLAVARIRRANTGFQAEYWDGSAYQSIGFMPYETGQSMFFDMFFSLDNSAGRCEFYVNNNFVGEFVGDTIHGTTVNLAEVQFTAIETREIVITNSEPTIGWRVKTMFPNGDGALTDWSGSYTGVDELDVNDGDVVTSTSGGDDEVYSVANFAAALDDFEVAAVQVGVRAKNDGAGPSGIEPIVYVGSTVYTNGVTNLEYDTTLDVAYRNFCRVWELNPNTTAAWTITQLEALQFGFRSIT